MSALAGRNGVNDKYDDAGILIRPTVKLESEMDIDPKTCSHGELVVNCSACAEIEKLIEENARLQPVIDAANAQEPIYQAQTVGGLWSDVTAENYAKHAIWRIVYARPIPAQQSPSVSDYEEVLASHRDLVRELDVLLNGEIGAAKQANLCDLVAQVSKVVRAENAPLLVTGDKMLFNGSHGHAGYVIDEQQSPAVVGDWSYGEDNDGWYVECKGEQVCYCASEANARRISEALSAKSPAVAVPKGWRIGDSFDKEADKNAEANIHVDGHLGKVVCWGVTIDDAIAMRDLVFNSVLLASGSSSTRITEQDARHLAESFKLWCDYTCTDQKLDQWINEEGRALLAKLNKPDSVGG